MQVLTPEQLADLRQKANAATPGPWKADLRVGKAMVYPSKYTPNCLCEVPYKEVVCTIQGVYRDNAWHMDKQQDDNAKYLAAADPATILQLLDMIERLEREADWLAKILSVTMGHDDMPEDWREAARKAIEEQSK